MSIGTISSSVWSPSTTSPSRPANGASQAPQAPPPPASTETGATSAGSADPFQQLSSDMQAKLLQLQSVGSDAASGNTTSASATGAMKPHPHHHPKGETANPDAASGLVPTQEAAGTTAPTATSGTNTSLFDAIRQAIQAYAASGQASAANLSTSLATM